MPPRVVRAPQWLPSQSPPDLLDARRGFGAAANSAHDDGDAATHGDHGDDPRRRKRLARAPANMLDQKTRDAALAAFPAAN